MTNIYFCTNNTIYNKLVRLFTGFKYSHVVIVKDGRIIDSSFPKGVKEYSFNGFLNNYKEYELITINFDDEVFNIAKKEIGKKYDLLAIFSFLFKRNWQEKDKWMCSELAAYCLCSAGYKLLKQRYNKISPKDLYYMLQEVK